MTLKGALFLLITALFTVSGQVMMKLGMPDSGSINARNVLTSPMLVVGAFCYAASFLSWLQVLNLLPLSIAMPSMSINFVIIVFVSYLVLGEPITMFKIMGVVLIVGGVVFVSQG